MPDHPRYPSAQSCLSGSVASILAYLFPRDSQVFMDFSEFARVTRIWVKIHVCQDIDVGLALWNIVAGEVIKIASGDN